MVSESPALDRLLHRIAGLRAKTVARGCTEAEALLAAAKVAELLDRHDLSLTDVDLRATPCMRGVFETSLRRRIPLDGCIGAIAHFCDCRVWREKDASGNARTVFFGLHADVDVALYLTELVDSAVRGELGRYKTSPEYQRFRHQDRHVANASFALGMVGVIGDRLMAMKAARAAALRGNGRDLVVVKAAVVDRELDRLGLKLQTVAAASRTVSPIAYDAGEAAGGVLEIDPRDR